MQLLTAELYRKFHRIKEKEPRAIQGLPSSYGLLPCWPPALGPVFSDAHGRLGLRPSRVAGRVPRQVAHPAEHTKEEQKM